MPTVEQLIDDLYEANYHWRGRKQTIARAELEEGMVPGEDGSLESWNLSGRFLSASPPHLDVFSQFGFRALKIFTFCDGGWVARVARIRHGAGGTQSRREEINATLHNQVSAPTMPGSLAPTAAAQPLIGR